MKKKSFNPVAWFVYCVFVFILFELALFCSGRSLLWQRRTAPSGAVTIACVGDSHTFGVGTSALYSYPMQLEALLNANNKAQKFSVANLGIPGSSTKRQVQELQTFLGHHDAQIVILLTGRNNNEELKQWANPSLYDKIVYRLGSLRSFRFLKVLTGRILGINKERYPDPALSGDQRYREYLNFYLSGIRKLCLDKSAHLVLLSYYNSSDRAVEDFARRYRIPYFDFAGDFAALFKTEEKLRYISPDTSHLNHLGYKFFAEQLYRHLFSQQSHLGIIINPLLQMPPEKGFYANDAETERVIRLQQERILQSKDTIQYPFELIHMGHIYTEIGNSEAAREYYLQALIISNYSDNNTIVSPIINWYLQQGRKDDAMKICDEILTHNPENNIAKAYRDQRLPR